MAPDAKPPLTGLTPEALAELLGGSGRAREVWRALSAGRNPFSDLPAKAQQRLARHCAGSPLRTLSQTKASCGTVKSLGELADGERIESVVIPARRRSTVCVSTQVGCARACRFCCTATLGLRRNLSAAEIVAQVVTALQLCSSSSLPPVRNIVLMGMGEPLDNLEAVRAALEICVHPLALAFAPRHITVSTVAPSPDRVREAATLPARLAWSLVAADDQVRRRLVPSTRHSAIELREAFCDALAKRRSHLFVEVVLVRGINDSVEQALALARFLGALQPKVRVNLLPLNNGRDGLQATGPAQTARFQQTLREQGYFCALRPARGERVNAACGQLAATFANGQRGAPQG